MEPQTPHPLPAGPSQEQDSTPEEVSSQERETAQTVRNHRTIDRFSPTDEEAIIDYLNRKINNPLVDCSISDANVYEHTPEELAGGVLDYNATQHQKEHLVQSQQYPMGKSPGFMLAATSSSNYPLQQDHGFSTSGTDFSFPRPTRNQDLHFRGSGLSKPRFYNPLSGKDAIPVQRSQHGPDDYGLLGLLKVIKGVNPAKTALALGVDQHSLVFDLNAREPLHEKFASPWSDEPLKQGPKYDIPKCYNSQQPPALKQSHFRRFNLGTLFYIFYGMPQDLAQLFAANELHDRGWYYYRELRMWFTRDKNSVPAVKNAACEVGCYIFFDPSTWQTIRRDKFVLYYHMIEQRPTIPVQR